MVIPGQIKRSSYNLAVGKRIRKRNTWSGIRIVGGPTCNAALAVASLLFAIKATQGGFVGRAGAGRIVRVE